MSNDFKDEKEPVPPLTPEEKKELKEADKIINKSRKLNPKERRYQKSQKEKQHEYEMVSRFLSEYLDNYVLLGFTTSSDEFVAMKYNNPLERRALTHLVDEFFSLHFNNMTDASKKEQEFDDDDEDDDEEY
jgi:hypothetical protein